MKKSQSSDYFNRLQKGLVIDEEGNITAAKDLEIDGTTKFNGGFNPIHSYVFTDNNANNYPFDVYAEVEIETNLFSFFGKYSNSFCYGIYRLENGKVSEIRLLYMNDISVNPYILHGDNYTGEATTDEGIKTMLWYQDKLYTHALTTSVCKIGTADVTAVTYKVTNL